MSKSSLSSKFNHGDFEDRYPKRNRKSKIQLNSLDEPEMMYKAERLSSLPYDIKELTTSKEFEHNNVVKSLAIEEFSLDYIKRTGLNTPLFFNEPPEKLGMKMPDPDNFSVDDVLDCIGGNRLIEVVEVYEQKSKRMKLCELIDYYKKPPVERKELFNVLSLEFSSTKLADLVSGPKLVREIDWIDNIWPKELLERQKNLDKMLPARDDEFSTYPKVQRYCLMSVAGCFTEYHIDFGGTSVWYHILKGEKIFWLIEPTQENLLLYESWILGGSSNNGFFGKVVNKCTRIYLKRGHTLFIPSGWIHCVYTPCDSLVFGGNFLHSFAIPMQFRVSRSEEKLKIQQKYRFPHEKQIIWCYIAQIVKFATGRIYQRPPTTHPYFLNKNQEKEGGNEIENANEENNEEIPKDDKIYHHKGDDICYDNYGNSADGSFIYNPIQLKYNEKMTKENFVPSAKYDCDYLRSLSPYEINGLHEILIFAKRLLRSKKKLPEVAEGITRPFHLLLEFEELVKKFNDMDLLNIEREFELCLKTKMTNQTVEYEKFANSMAMERVQMNVKLEPKKSTKRHSLDSSEAKKSKKINKMVEKKLILVDGLPSAISEGSIHAEDVVPLGRQPIASAWRQSRQMTKPPPAPAISILKRKSTESSQQNSSLDVKIESGNGSQSNSMEDFAPPEKKISIPTKRPAKCIPKIAKLLENHDDSPELAHKSPLQRCLPDPKSTTQNGNHHYRRESFSSSYSSHQTSDHYQRFPTQRGGPFDGGGDDRRQWRPQQYSNNNQNSYGNERGGYYKQNEGWGNSRRGGGFRGRGNWQDRHSSTERNRDENPLINSSDPFSSKSDPFANSTDPFSSKSDPFANSTDPFSSKSDPFANSTDPFSSKSDPFSSNPFNDSPPANRMAYQQQQFDEKTHSTTSMENDKNAAAAEEDMEIDMDIEDDQQQEAAMENRMGFVQKSGMLQQDDEFPFAPQPMNITVNELHHISQIMNNPVAASDFLEQIPLPPSPTNRMPATNTADEMENNKSTDETNVQPSGDAFHEVDELANLAQLFSEQN